MFKKYLKTISLGLVLSCHATVQADTFTEQDEINSFINEMVQKHKFDKNELQNLFAKAEKHQTILDAIARPAEGKPWHEYRPIFITRDRIRGGIEFWQKHTDALQRASQQFGVPEEIIVAIIGVETRYGQHAGRYPVLESLSTLAFAYPPRGRFFRGQLEHFLLMCREEKIDPMELKGSYAGAMGFPQFIPSSYRSYAIDFDHDGKRDLWNNPVDAIGSVANYFKRHNWQNGKPITHMVQVHGARYKNLLDNNLKPQHTQQQLLDNGVVLPGDLPKSVVGKLLEFETMKKPEYWVGWENFYVITRYNHSALYSMAVFQLSEKIREGYKGQ